VCGGRRVFDPVAYYPYTALRARAVESQEVALAPREGDDAVCALYLV
jgi:hypothetical protein